MAAVAARLRPQTTGTTLAGGERSARVCSRGRTFLLDSSRGGCFAQFAEEAFDPAADIAGQDAAIKATAQSGAYVAATAYAAQQGLVVPMRSSIVRGILDIGEVGGEAIALIPTIYAEGQALNNEVKSFANGECQ